VHDSTLELRSLHQIKYLQGPRLGLEGDDLLFVVHDGTVGIDGTLDDLIVVLEIDDDDFGFGII
jgi:hypothetical protein